MQEQSREQGLWSGVILQARDDISHCDMHSVDYAAAVAFFTRDGEWGESRAAIADHLGLHADDLEQAGRGWIAERQRRSGLTAESVKPDARPQPMAVTPQRVVETSANVYDYGQIIRRRDANNNPFNPHRAGPQSMPAC